MALVVAIASRKPHLPRHSRVEFAEDGEIGVRRTRAFQQELEGGELRERWGNMLWRVLVLDSFVPLQHVDVVWVRDEADSAETRTSCILITARLT